MPAKTPSVAIQDAVQSATPVASGPTRVGFVSLGCPKNLVDSEVMMGLLQQAGAELVSGAEDADVIVVNTCSFIASAQQESVNTILEMAKHKSAGRARKLVVAGCLVERFRNDIRQNIPEVDAVVGTGELEGILAAAGIAPARPVDSPFRILQSRAEGDARAEQGRFSRESWDGAIADLPNYLYDEATPRVLATPRHTAYIKIAEGCDHPCTFCIIPQLRGQFRSRRFESVIAEAERLARLRGWVGLSRREGKLLRFALLWPGLALFLLRFYLTLHQLERAARRGPVAVAPPSRAQAKSAVVRG